MRHHNFFFLNSSHSVGRCRSGAPVVSYQRRDYKVSYRHSSVAIMRWNSEEHAFAVEASFSSRCSVIATQCAFRNRFNFAPLAPLPDQKLIVMWVTTFRQTASATRRRTGLPRPIRSRENIEAVRASMLRSPWCSAREHASALGLYDRSVRRILHEYLHFHPYKMAIVQELYERDFNSRRNSGEVLLEVVPEDAIVFFSDEVNFHLCGSVNKHALLGWHQSSTIAWKAFAFTQSHSVVRNFLRWNYWSLVLWGKWSHIDSEFGPVCKHVTGIVFPTARWVGLRGHLVPTRRWLFWGNTSRSASSQLGAIWSGRPALPIWPLVIFFYGVFWNPVFM